MKILVENYTFDASAKTVTFTDYAGPGIVAERLFMVVNVTDGVFIYLFSLAGRTGSVAGNILTVDFDTSAMSDTDKLLIIYDDPDITSQPISGTVTETNSADIEALLTLIAASLSVVDDWDDGANRANVVETNSATIVAALAAIAASLSVMDDWDESNRAAVNLIVGQVGVQGASGVVTALTLRAVLATDVALPAGTNLLGKVGIDQTTPGTTNAVAPISGQAGVEGNIGAATAKTQRVALATDGNTVQGTVAHDVVDTGNPMKVGYKAIAHGTNPTAVTAGRRTDSYANRAGIPWVIGGHPNIVTIEYNSTGSQTDDPIIDSISSGTKIVVTQIDATCDNANTGDTGVRIGFSATTLVAEGASGAVGVAGIVLSHPGIPAGGGIVKGNGSGIIGIGGDGEELRITCESPGGKIRVVVTYYTIES